jgi:hypothetical protein
MAADRAGPDRPARRDASPEKGEIYLEYRVIGAQMRVDAIDAATGVEVTVFGPKTLSEKELGGLAVRKLKHRLATMDAEEGTAADSATARPGGRYA